MPGPGQSRRIGRAVARNAGAAGLIALALSLCAFTWPWDVNGPWPSSSERPVAPLSHPSVETALAGLPGGPSGGFRFVAFGDQRAVADGEWQALMAAIAARAEGDARLLFMLDTGDIVNDGRHADQFALLADILAPAADLPYVVSVGNHELKDNRSPVARQNTAVCLAGLDADFGVGRMYYAKQLGRLRLLVLDSNDLVYGDDGSAKAVATPAPGSRAEAQWRWLVDQLARPEPEGVVTVVAMHHPIVQSSKKHREAASGLWNLRVDGRSLPELFLDGGVDLVLCGHTHTFEQFRLARGGRAMHLINLSGRPRDSVLGWGAGARRARDILGRETERLADWGWKDLDGWTIDQVDAMTRDEADEFAVFDLPPEGPLSYTVHFLDEDAPAGLRDTEPRQLD